MYNFLGQLAFQAWKPSVSWCTGTQITR